MNSEGNIGGCTEISYGFRVINESNNGEVLENVELIDPLLNNGQPIPGPNPGDDIGNDGVMSPGEAWTYTFDYTITQADIDNGQVVNQATVTADVQGQPGVTVSDLSDDDSELEDDPTVVDLSHCHAEIGLIKVGNPLDGLEGGPGCNLILYTFTVTNEGPEILEHIVLNDPMLGGVIPGPDSGDDNNNNLLDPGEIWNYSAAYNTTEVDIVNGQVVNQANVSSNVQGMLGVVVEDLSDDNSVLEDDPTVIDLSFCVPDIAVVKTGAALDGIEGNPGCNLILYTFTVTNQGAVVLEDILLTDPMLGGEIPGPYIGDDNNDGLLDLDEVWTYSAAYNTTQADIDNGQVVNQAEVYADAVGVQGLVFDISDDDSVLEDDPTVIDLSFCQDSSIAMIKEGVLVDITGDGCFDSILYTFTVTNTGNTDLEHITLEDDLFGGEIPGPVEGTDEGNDGILSSGETWTYEALYGITQQDVDNGSVINQATVSGYPIEQDFMVSDLSDNDSLDEDEPTRTPVPDDVCPNGSADMGMIKEAELVDLDQDGCIDSIRYTFTVTNAGSADLEQITLEDDLFGGEIPGPVEGTDEGNDGILSSGETWIYEALYVITQEDIDNGSVINQATVSGQPVGLNIPVFDLSDNDSLDEDEPTRTPVPDDACPSDGTPLFGIAIIKDAAGEDTDFDGCDDSINYSFTVINTGSIDLENIVLSDELLGGEVNGLVNDEETQDGILQPGEEWLFTATYNLTQEDIESTIIYNQAQVTADLVGSTDAVFDDSDDDSYLENDATATNVSNFCEFTGGPGFEIFNGITPNGDGSNDFFRIQGIENYPDNNVKIFNRWGVLVYQTDSYGQENNLFHGISEGRATLQEERKLPSGTYFYILTFTSEDNPGEESYSGYLYINRN
ncbi:MAG: gliding motility-associated C-terminal domain-containing protein [Muricauda sp.]|nr:gliding motility-associated C-terminal domain-containing protein [Allomuricauda sp.]MBA4743842.1 gliding motility-associated C-terminal domain-containing protein [Allomuricauda sp.]